MARAGGGHVGGGGHSSGGGHHSSSHSGGGHHSSFGGSSSSSRAGSSRSSSSWSGSTRSSSSSSWTNATRKTTPPPNMGGAFNRPPTVNIGRGAMSGMGGGYMGTNVGPNRRRSSGGCIGCGSVAAVIIIILIMMIVISAMFSSFRGAVGYSSGYTYNSVTVPASSYNREKLSGTTWTNNCVVDEIGWISEDGSISGLERQLRTFYDKTGVQPYVYLVGYDPSLRTDAEKEQFAYDYYENNIGNTYTFAFFYFEEANPNDVGYMYYEGGSQALGVMDAEAVEIFWAITDQEWYGNGTTEDCLANMFNRTAERIMTRTTTKTDVAKIVAIIVLVIVIVAGIIAVMNKRRKDEKARNEETKRILETPLE